MTTCLARRRPLRSSEGKDASDPCSDIRRRSRPVLSVAWVAKRCSGSSPFMQSVGRSRASNPRPRNYEDRTPTSLCRRTIHAAKAIPFNANPSLLRACRSVLNAEHRPAGSGVRNKGLTLFHDMTGRRPTRSRFDAQTTATFDAGPDDRPHPRTAKRRSHFAQTDAASARQGAEDSAPSTPGLPR